jgi:hypothetical protein
MKTLLVSPQAGMCNRFRVLCSAILLARLSGRKLYHCWEKEAPHAIDMEHIQHMRESSFDSFFVEAPAIPFLPVNASTRIDQVFSEWGPGDFWYAMQRSAIQRNGWDGELHIERSSADALLASQADTVLLETSLCLKPSSLTHSEFEHELSDIYTAYFKPLPLFQDVVERFARGGPYVGVHIRRTDHLRYVRAADISVKNWEKIIRRYVSTSEAICFCSDDEAFVKAVTARLPEYRIVPVDQTFSHTPGFQAFIEFVCLSKAARIYGTVGSSFSREAARFGAVPFVLCSAIRPDTLLKRLLYRLGPGLQQVACTELPGPFPGSVEII